VSAVGIRVEHVSKQFSHRLKGLVYAVKDVSLTVQPGNCSPCWVRPDAGRRPRSG